ncbi:ABC transporter permease subunit [Rathayibacter sp. VKM Ac-2803]|uniref:ABC transporter permease n=1 Tax=unclassified Rathayibacter TaxID=2609250 RepID=UPI00135CB6E9|nr:MULTISPECIES: ABC transporter permease subunit [unclassified Rathayibacter]MWV51268.1 ABC transporter permease subunit [Rathayibacter sp. VKM Ac-2803]MWV57754.1 ABC transporter permease subunit [Rathayibacter sp. VKM Ac-2754]
MSRILRGLVHLWPILLVLVAWDAWVVLNGYTATVAPRPWPVISDVVLGFGAYLPSVSYTLGVALVGLVGGTAVGFLAAILVWSSAAISGVVTPAALIIRSVPITAMIPIIARIVGYGDPAVVTSTVLICFFPAFVFTLSGLAAIPAAGRDLFRVLGAGRLQLLGRLGILYALPNLMVSVRITAPTAVLGAMLAEFLMGANGLGALFSESRSYMDMERSWGVALVATVVSVLVFLAARGVEHRVVARVS